MPSELELVLWELDTDELIPIHEEPRVLVDPAIEAFCVVKARTARGTTPPPTPGSGRLSRELIERYLLENAETTDDDDP